MAWGVTGGPQYCFADTTPSSSKEGGGDAGSVAGVRVQEESSSPDEG